MGHNLRKLNSCLTQLGRCREINADARKTADLCGIEAVLTRQPGEVYEIQILPPQPRLSFKINGVINPSRLLQGGLCSSGYHMGTDRDQTQAGI